jgi:hypothetical protein
MDPNTIYPCLLVVGKWPTQSIIYIYITRKKEEVENGEEKRLSIIIF